MPRWVFISHLLQLSLVNQHSFAICSFNFSTPLISSWKQSCWGHLNLTAVHWLTQCLCMSFHRKCWSHLGQLNYRFYRVLSVKRGIFGAAMYIYLQFGQLDDFFSHFSIHLPQFNFSHSLHIEGNYCSVSAPSTFKQILHWKYASKGCTTAWSGVSGYRICSSRFWFSIALATNFSTSAFSTQNFKPLFSTMYVD